MIMKVLKWSYGNVLRRLRRSGRSKAIPKVITFISVIENKFGSDGAEAEKIMHKCSQSVWGLFEIRESRWHQFFEEIICLRWTLLASQSRKIKIKSTYQGTRFALRIKIVHLCGLFAKNTHKFYCLTQRHRWRPRASFLWGDRDDHMETTNRPSRPDRLEIFWNDWGDRDDPDDHMKTRLKVVAEAHAQFKGKKTSYKTIWRITLLCSHGEVHPFETFESFQSELLAGSIFFHLLIIKVHMAMGCGTIIT